jgi:HEPN domain-containing protein
VKLLDQIYIPTRYPDAIPGTLPEGVPNKAQAVDALEMAQEIFDLVQEEFS